MFRSLGWGWGSTLLACVAVVALPAPAIVGQSDVRQADVRCSDMGNAFEKSLHSMDESCPKRKDAQ